MHAKPLTCLRPLPEKAAEFASLPYDVFDRAEAAAYVKAHPTSFLAIDRPETAFGPEQDMYAPEVYAKAAELLKARVADHTLIPDTAPCYYAWRLVRNGRAQTGIVAACSVDEYLSGTIKRHELTRRDKEQDRVNHILATSAQTGPIFLAYRDEPTLDIIISAACAAEPLYDFTDGGNIHHTIWRIARTEAVAAIDAMFERIPCAYIADGHHRTASAMRAAQHKREAQPDTQPDTQSAADKNNLAALAPYDEFLAVLFPDNQLEILPYNRVVSDMADRTPAQLLEALQAQGYTAEKSDVAVEPTTHATVGMFCAGQWYTLTLDPACIPDDPVERLDCSLLQNRVLAPIFGIEDPTTNKRISFVGGIRGTEELERRAGTTGVAFSMHATSIQDLLAVADANKLMPPKSTWFEPKLLSGLFIRKI